MIEITEEEKKVFKELDILEIVVVNCAEEIEEKSIMEKKIKKEITYKFRLGTTFR